MTGDGVPFCAGVPTSYDQFEICNSLLKSLCSASKAPRSVSCFCLKMTSFSLTSTSNSFVERAQSYPTVACLSYRTKDAIPLVSPSARSAPRTAPDAESSLVSAANPIYGRHRTHTTRSCRVASTCLQPAGRHEWHPHDVLILVASTRRTNTTRLIDTRSSSGHRLAAQTEPTHWAAHHLTYTSSVLQRTLAPASPLSLRLR